MTKGPFRAAVSEGALALEHGWDPLSFLGLEHEDRLVAKEILELAEERRQEQQQQLWKSLTNCIQNGVARAFKPK